MADMDFSRFKDFLKQYIGLDTLTVGETLIERAILDRMDHFQASPAGLRQNTATAIASYWDYLTTHLDERQQLIENVVVPETSFFRHPESFPVMIRHVLGLQAASPNRTLRILSLPCSTGEEPYSIAMALQSAGMPLQRTFILGIDISDRVLQHARKAIYGKNSFRGERTDFRNLYFSPDGQGLFSLNRAIRDQVQFRSGNLLDPLLLQNESRFDIIFCRNVLIYFDRPTQQLALKKLLQLLAPGGAVFVAPAEGALLATNGFRPSGPTSGFSYIPDTSPAPTSIALRLARVTTQTFVPPISDNRTRPVTAFHAQGVAPPMPAGTIIKPVECALLTARVLADKGLFPQALVACEKYLQTHPGEAEGHYLYGVICDAQNRTSEALGAYRKALYLVPEHAEALAHMAALLRQNGDTAGANRLEQRLHRLNSDTTS
jgi:chemotaxis protein methyltransferase WspC